MLNRRVAVQATHRFAVVRKLREIEFVINEFDARSDAQAAGGPPFVFDIRLRRSGVELLVKIRQRLVDPRAWIRRRLETIGLCELIPETRSEYSEARSLRNRHKISVLAIAVELIDRARRRKFGGIIVILLV